MDVSFVFYENVINERNFKVYMHIGFVFLIDYTHIFLIEKTEIVRMNQEGVRTVQMYGTTGDSMYVARPESVNTNRSELANNNEPISEDDQSVRTMIVSEFFHLTKT